MHTKMYNTGMPVNGVTINKTKKGEDESANSKKNIFKKLILFSIVIIPFSLKVNHTMLDYRRLLQVFAVSVGLDKGLNLVFMMDSGPYSLLRNIAWFEQMQEVF